MRKLLVILGAASLCISAPLIMIQNINVKNDDTDINLEILNQEVDFQISNNDTEGIKVFLYSPRKYIFSVYSEAKLIELTNIFEKALSFLSENSIDIVLYRQKIDIYKKEWYDFYNQDIQSKNKIILKGINDYKLQTRQLFHSKNSFYNFKITEYYEKYKDSRNELNFVNAELSNIRNLELIYKSIVLEFENYKNIKNSILNFYDKWTNGLFTILESMNEVIYGEYENDEDYLIKFADEYKQMVEIILSKFYGSSETLENQTNKLYEFIQEDNSFENGNIAEWLQNKEPTESLGPLESVDFILEHIKNKLVESGDIGFVDREKIIFESIRDVLKLMATKFTTFNNIEIDLKNWSSNILASAYPELELIFKEHGLSVGIEEEYFMDTFNSIFETVIFTVGKVVGIANKLISKSSSLIKYVLKIVGADLAIIGIAINTEFKSIEKEIKILSEWLLSFFKIPPDVEENALIAENELKNIPQKIEELTNQKIELEQLLEGDKTEYYLESFANWNDTFNNKYFDYLNIGDISKKNRLNELTYYQNNLKKYKDNYYDINFYLKLSKLSKFEEDQNKITEINNYIESSVGE